MEYIKGERPPPRQKFHHLLACLLTLQLALLLTVSLWFFVSFENQGNAPQLKQIPQLELLQETSPQPNDLDGFIGWLYLRVALGPIEPRPPLRSGQVLTKVSSVTKVVIIGLAARLFYAPLTNRSLQKNSVVWCVFYHRYLADEEESRSLTQVSLKGG